MSIFKFLGLFFASLFLSVSVACSDQTPSVSVPAGSPAAETATTDGMASMGKPRININSAILSELDKLEAKLGVPALSNKIQASRPYGKVEELVSKNVVTQEQFDQIKNMVTIEDVVLTGEARDVDYMTKLGLMKGHLLVAGELLALQKPDQAEPHIGHPVEEIYADVEEQLTERNVKEFKSTLIALQDRVRAGAKDTAKVNTEFKTSVQAVDTAIAALPAEQRESSRFVLQAINGLLDTASSEYGAAIANGKISQVIEYQDSRGFVTYANQLYKEIAPQLATENATVNQSIKETMAQLSSVWPAPVPPATPVKTPEQVSKLVKTIELNTQKILKST